MGRKTFRKVITDEETLLKINPKNLKLAERFLREKNTRCSDTTIKGYKSDLNIFWCWNYKYNDDAFFINIKKLDLADFFAYCVDELKWSSNRFARMRSCLSSLSLFIEKFYDSDYPEFRNIVLSAIDLMPKVERREKTVLSEEQVDSLFEYLDKKNSSQKKCMLALLIASGVRRSEVLRFTTDIIDEEYTAFEGIFLETTNKIKTKGRTKEGKLLVKYIIKDLFLPHYKEWLIKRKEILKKNNLEDHGYVFIKPDGTPITNEQTVNSRLEELEKFLGCPIYPHAFRHYACTFLTRLGLEQELVVEIFGWSSADMFNIYCDLNAKDRKWKGLGKMKEKLNREKE